MQNGLDAFRKAFIHPQNWEGYKEGIRHDLLDNLSSSEKAIAIKELIGSVPAGNTRAISALIHLHAQEALPVLLERLFNASGVEKVMITRAVYALSSDANMISLAVNETRRMETPYQLLEIMYELAAFRNEETNALLQQFQSHPDYLVRYNATRALGLPTDDVVKTAAGPYIPKPMAISQEPPATIPQPDNKMNLMAPQKDALKWALLASIGCFLLSLTMDCFCTTVNCSHSSLVFLLGWLSMLQLGPGITWLANPLLIAAWIGARKQKGWALPISLLAFIISLSFLLFGQITDNEGGIAHPIVSYKAGYWLWVVSPVILCVGLIRLPASKVWVRKHFWLARMLGNKK